MFEAKAVNWAMSVMEQLNLFAFQQLQRLPLWALDRLGQAVADTCRGYRLIGGFRHITDDGVKYVLPMIADRLFGCEQPLYTLIVIVEAKDDLRHEVMSCAVGIDLQLGGGMYQSPLELFHTGMKADGRFN